MTSKVNHEASKKIDVSYNPKIKRKRIRGMHGAEDGAHQGINFGLLFVIIAVIIGLIVAGFSIARNLANDGMLQVQGAVGDMNQAAYNDYDQKVVAGSMVLSAYNQFSGKQIAIIVKTCKGDWVNYNALVLPFSTTTVSQTPAPFKGLTKDATSKQYSSSVSFFSQTAASTDINLVMSSDPDIEKRVTLFNNVTTNMNLSGNSNYVNPTAKYNTYLVRDAGDTIVGIVFIQQGKHTVGT